MIPLHPADISVTVFTNPTKLTNDPYKPYTLVGPTVTRPVQDPLAVVLLDNRLYIPIVITIF